MKVVLVHNKRAGDRDHPPGRLLKLLQQNGYRPIPVSIRQFQRTRGAVPAADLVIAAGGDGTVKKVACALAGSGRLLAILPTGTANNIAHGLGITGPPERVIAGWAKSRRLPLDLGVAEGPWGRRYFIESLGVGLIGRAIGIMTDIADVATHALATREDRLYRDLCVCLAVAREIQPVPLMLTVDGRRASRGRFLLCELLNIRRAGPGVELSRSAEPSDGFLDLVSVEASERNKLLTLLQRCLAGRAPAPLLRTRRVRRVKLVLGPHEMRIDDELVWPPRAGPRPRRIGVTVEVAPGALEFLRPRASREDRR